MAEPFLKWAGGKRILLPQLRSLVPPLPDGATYFEPFLGGGALFFSVKPSKAVLADKNPHLIEAFVAVRDNVERVISSLRRLSTANVDYYRVRSSRPRHLHSRAARFVYLNKTCFNGLYRENKKGEFNVPRGRHGHNLLVCNEAQLREASAALQHADLRARDFVETVHDASPGDMVYFDPPYTIAHANNGFIEYNANVFAWEDQFRLAELAASLVARGVNVLVSNAQHDSIESLYSGFGCLRRVELQRWSTVAADATRRFPTRELAFVGGPYWAMKAESDD